MENFKKLGNGTSKVNVVIRLYGITFSRACVTALNNARFVTLALDEENAKLAVRAAEQTETDAFPFFKDVPKGKQLVVRVSSRAVLKAIEYVTGVVYDTSIS